MTEPVFKLLRCDAEASHMLGWAKKEVRRLVDFAHLDAFNRTWKFGDVSVRAQYFGGVARLWLEAEATERTAVWVTLPNPVPYRLAEIVPTAEQQMVGDAFASPWGVVASDLQVLGGATQYSRNYAHTSGVSTDDPMALFYYGQQYNATPYDANRVWTGANPVEAYRVTFDATPGEVMHAYYTPVTLDEVPSDVLGLFDAGGGTWPGDYPFSGVTYPSAMAFPTFTEDAFPKTEWQAKRSAEATAGREHNRTWVTQVSAAVMEGLRSGVFDLPFRETSLGKNPLPNRLPRDFSYAIKDSVPKSTGVYRELGCSVDVADDVVHPPLTEGVLWSGYPAQKTTYKTTRTVTFKYQKKNQQGAVEEIEETITGECTVTYIALAGFQGWWVKYTDWYCKEDVLQFNVTYDYPLVSDSSLPRHVSEHINSRGLVWNGTTTYRMPQYDGNATSFYDTDTYYKRLYPRALSIVRYPWLLTHGDGYYWTDGTSIKASPVKHSTDLSAAIPAPIKNWHQNNPPRYKKGGGAANMYADFADKAEVVVIPLCFVGADGVVRSFIRSDWFDEYYLNTANERPVAVEVYGRAIYKYDVATRDFVYSRWEPLPDSQESVRIPWTLGMQVNANALVIYGGIKWDDVKEEARAQRKALADPNDPAHDPLMKAVLDALTPAE